MSAAKSSSRKRKRDDSPTRELTVELSSTKTGKGGPYLISYPAVTPPESTAFKCYARKKSKNLEHGIQAEPNDDILLAGETDVVEFMTNEAETERAADSGSQYFLAVHNRRTGKVTLLPQAKTPHLLTHTVKALKSIEPAAVPSKTQFREAKNALGDTFGTKKAKAAIRAQERNHVDIGAMAGVMNYVMDSIQKGAEGLMTTDEAKEFADSNRLIPSFDATATEPNDVYPLHNIIPEAEWKALSVSAFDSTTNDKERLALLPHRHSDWVRRQLKAITTSKDSAKTKKKNLKILLYISGMLAFRQATFKKDIEKDRIYEKLAPLPTIVADSLLSRFTEVPRGTVLHQSTSATKTNLLTHMFALCLKLENFAADTETISKDLSMKTSEINQLFKTLGTHHLPRISSTKSLSDVNPSLLPVPGCKISKLSDRERTRLGIADSVAETKRAVLAAPVEFPKPRLKRKT
ncbi:hypothetical protein MD484_g5302, partial [Candolleomyces efflorescens]